VATAGVAEAGWTLAVTRVLLDGEGQVEAREVVAVAAASSTATAVEIPIPAASALQDTPLGPRALYALSLLDEGGGSAILGASPTLLAWDGEAPESWHAVGGAAAEVDAPSPWTVADGRAPTPLQIGASWDLTLGFAVDRLTTRSAYEADSLFTGARPVDEPADPDAPLSLALSDPPAAERIQTADGGLPTALESLLAIADGDESDSYTAGDPAVALLCDGETAVQLAYWPPPADLHAALAYAASGVPAGWAAVRSLAPLDLLDAGEATGLALSDTACWP
jgi:hypothetical protein